MLNPMSRLHPSHLGPIAEEWIEHPLAKSKETLAQPPKKLILGVVLVGLGLFALYKFGPELARELKMEMM
jgi:hypothetical protein